MPTDACTYFHDCTACGRADSTEAGRLLRVLFVRLVQVPADTARGWLLRSIDVAF